MFKQIFYKFATPTGVLTSLFIVVVILFFFNDNFRNKNSEWFFDGISKLTGKTSASNNLSIHFGDGDATVSQPFKDATQACWYYHANYEHSHPYTLLWERSEETKNFPKIRVIAQPAYWSAQDCRIEKGDISLIGIEYTKHTIEAQFNDYSNFIPIATSEAYYKSKLNFDKEGRITDRKVLISDFTCKILDAFSSPTKYCSVFTQKQNQAEKKIEIKKLKTSKDSFNYLEIIPNSKYTKNVAAEEYDLYKQAINLYVLKRNELHEGLAKEGCGAISIEPKFEDDYGNINPTMLAFLCYKKAGGSHVRMMRRTADDIWDKILKQL